MDQAKERIDELWKNGFVMFRGFFTQEQAAQAHRELEDWYRRDLEERKAKGVTDAHHDGVAGHTVLTAPSHLMIDVYGKSPTLDAMYERLLTDPESAPVLHAMAGRNIKLRGYNVRRMTGAYDPPPAHEWHRDSPGEIGFGILLTDVPPGEHAATALVPGSHHFPTDARWDHLFSAPYRGLGFFLKLNLMNRLLARTALRNATGAHGGQGDAYFFINDIWHGRQPNLHGRQSMIVLIGAFPTEFPFPDTVKEPPAEVVARLPPTMARFTRHDQPPNEGADTLLHRMLRERRDRRPGLLFKLARAERRAFDRLSARLQGPLGHTKKFVVGWSVWSYYAARGVVKRALGYPRPS